MIKRIVTVCLVVSSIICNIACSDSSKNEKSIVDVGYLPHISDDDAQQATMYLELDMTCNDNEIPQVQGKEKYELSDEEAQKLKELFDTCIMGELPTRTYSFNILIDMGSKKLMMDMSKSMAYYVKEDENVRILEFKLSDEQKVFVEELIENTDKAEKDVDVSGNNEELKLQLGRYEAEDKSFIDIVDEDTMIVFSEKYISDMAASSSNPSLSDLKTSNVYSYEVVESEIIATRTGSEIMFDFVDESTI